MTAPGRNRPDRVLLHVGHLSKTYPGQVALKAARLDVRPGEVHALVGQNGSGKSTLIKLLAGYVKADHGARVAFDGVPVDLWSAPPDVRRRIRIVHQDLGLVPTLSAVENLGLGRGWARGRSGRILWRDETAQAQTALLRFGLAPDVRVPVASLTAAERAAIAIVRALQDWKEGERGLLVLDEPTASLNRGEVDALFREVRRVAAAGNGVIFVSHILEEVLELADRVTVLRDGEVIADGVPVSDLDQKQLVELIVGRAIDDLYAARPHVPGRTVLEAQMLVGMTLRGVSLKVAQGEVLGIAGLVGSGRDEIAGCLFGSTPRFAGKVTVEKRKVYTDPRESIEAGMALVPADRKNLGLIMEERLVEHVPLPRYGPLQSRGRLSHRAVRSDVARWVDKLEVQPPALGRRMEKFSGGNQQKAVLARWLRTEPKVLLLDEPTQGVDVGAKGSIYRHVAEAAADGMAVLLTSSDAEELVHMCDRVLVLRGGTVAAELHGAELTEERVVTEMLGSTSNRKGTRVKRRIPNVKVIRDDTAAQTASLSGPPDDIAPATGELPVTTIGGRLLEWARRARRARRARSIRDNDGRGDHSDARP